MENANYRENIGKKITVTDLKKSENGKYSIAKASEYDNNEVFIVSEKTENLILVAVVVNNNNKTEKWIAASEDFTIIEPEIRNIIDDDSEDEYYCLYEKTCGSIIYLKRCGVKYYLLIENNSGHIGFPKGHVEFGETEVETAKREVFEETFLKVSISEDTRQEYTYTSKEGIIKNCVYFCSEFTDELIRLQEGEITRCWLVPYEEAYKLLNYPQDRVIFEKADKIQ